MLIPVWLRNAYLGLLPLLIASSAVKAGPIPAGAVAETQFIQTTANPPYQLQTGSYTQETSTQGSTTAVGFANLALGTVGSAIAGISAPFSQFSTVNAWDFVSFNFSGGPRNIGYGLDYDGLLTLSSSNSYAYSVTNVFVYDVTELSTYFITESSGLTHPVPLSPSSCTLFGAYAVGSSYVGFSPGTASPSCSFTTDIRTLPSVPDQERYQGTVQGSFSATAGRVYLIQLTSNTNIIGDGTVTGADFGHTATFRFTNLGDATFDSASGTFLSAQAVPEPSTWVLSGMGLLGLGLRGAMKRGYRPMMRLVC